MSGDLIRSSDAMKLAEASYVRGQRDVLLNAIDAINAAQEHGNPREASELLRQFINGILATLPEPTDLRTALGLPEAAK